MDVTLLDLINYKIVLFFPLPTLQISNILLYHMSCKALEISTCEFSFFSSKLPISFDSFFGFAEFFIFSLFSSFFFLCLVINMTLIKINVILQTNSIIAPVSTS